MRFRPRLGSALKRLVPGVGVERWLLMLFGGITIVTLGVGCVLVDICRTYTVPSVIYYLTLWLIPRVYPGLLWGVAGVAAITTAVLQLHRLLLSAFRARGQSSLAGTFNNHGPRIRRPSLVAMGGGTRQSAPRRTTALVPAVCNVA